MGRYTERLAPQLVDAAEVGAGMRVLDVGCGPGGLTEVIADRVGVTGRVAGIDPSPPFVAACRAAVPAADVREGTAEHLPWPDDAFQVTLSCLVIGFMQDPARGVAEMARVTEPGGRVGACFWDVPRHRMLALAQQGIASVRPDLDPHPPMVGTARDDIPSLMTAAGLSVEDAGELEVRVDYADFSDLWEPISRAPGPIGDALVQLSVAEQVQVERYLRAQLPVGPFELSAFAWYAVARV
ncbi:methyltransferase domain-containing protein [Nocardioides dubius]